LSPPSGWAGTGAWTALFGAELGGSAFPEPDAIYAADPKAPAGPAGDKPSQRPFETVVPLGDRLGKAPVTTWAPGKEGKLVDEIEAMHDGVVLVCWEHKAIISGILPAIARGQDIPGLPTKWDGTRFDVVLRFDRAAPGAPWVFQQQFPMLLFGDSNTGVDKPVTLDGSNGSL
jgi:hypothetical protein